MERHAVPGAAGPRPGAYRRCPRRRSPGLRPGDGRRRHPVVVRYSRGPRLPFTAGRPDESLVERGAVPLGDRWSATCSAVTGARSGPCPGPAVVAYASRLDKTTPHPGRRFSTGHENVGRCILLVVGLRELRPGQRRPAGTSASARVGALPAFTRKSQVTLKRWDGIAQPTREGTPCDRTFRHRQVGTLRHRCSPRGKRTPAADPAEAARHDGAGGGACDILRSAYPRGGGTEGHEGTSGRPCHRR